MISDPENWWPFDAKDFSDLALSANLNEGIIPFVRAKKRGAEQILAQLQKYKKGASGLNSGTISELAPRWMMDIQNTGTTGKSTVVHIARGSFKAPVLTIKIIYAQPRNFLDNNAVISVRKMAFSAYQDQGNLFVRFETHG